MSASKSKNWNREELILAFNLYLKIPFGSIHKRNPKIIGLAHRINRTPSAVGLKMCNFASFDPYHQARGISGMRHTGKLDKEIFDEFSNNWADLLFESECILAKMEKTTIEKKFEPVLSNLSGKEGKTKVSRVKTRINQDVFRSIILAIYSNSCAVSHVNIPDLLVASHIIPWSKNESERLNPQNGICLSALYDKAFDGGFIGINTDYTILISPALNQHKESSFFMKYFGDFEDKVINLPDRFLPKTEFLDYHLQHIYRS